MPRLLSLFILLTLCLFSLVPLHAEDAAPTVTPTITDRALATSVVALARFAQQTAGQEEANFVLEGWPHNMTGMLGGEIPANAEQLNSARGMVSWHAEVLAKAATWPHPEEIKLPFTSSTPSIDGVLKDAAWKKALVFQGSYAVDSLEMTPNTTWRVLWDSHYLYVGVECRDSDIIAPQLARDGEIYLTDCVEVFILPEMATRAYWELEVGATGAIFDAQCVKSAQSWGGKVDTSATMTGFRSAVKVDGTPNTPGDTDTGYTVEMSIPFSAFPGWKTANAKAGNTFNLLLGRIDKSTRRHFIPYAFRPQLSWFHNIWNYSPVKLVK